MSVYHGRLPGRPCFFSAWGAVLFELLADCSENGDAQEPEFDLLRMVVDKDNITLIRTEDYEVYCKNPDGDYKIQKMEYLLAEDELNLYPEVTDLILDESEREPEIQTLHCILYRDKERESQVDASTKTEGSWNWISNAPMTPPQILTRWG